MTRGRVGSGGAVYVRASDRQERQRRRGDGGDRSEAYREEAPLSTHLERPRAPGLVDVRLLIECLVRNCSKALRKNALARIIQDPTEDVTHRVLFFGRAQA